MRTVYEYSLLSVRNLQFTGWYQSQGLSHTFQIQFMASAPPLPLLEANVAAKPV